MQISRIILLTFLCSLNFYTIYSQKTNELGILKGTIYDDNKPLPFANIFIEGTALGGSSDENGFFEIANIPVGTYKVIVSFTGYNSIKKNLYCKNLNISGETCCCGCCSIT